MRRSLLALIALPLAGCAANGVFAPPMQSYFARQEAMRQETNEYGKQAQKESLELIKNKGAMYPGQRLYGDAYRAYMDAKYPDAPSSKDNN